MRIVHNETHRLHAPGFFLVRGERTPCPETPERAEVLLREAIAAGHRPLAAGALPAGVLARVHSPAYLRFLQTAWREWRQLPGASAEVLPNVHPAREPASYPDSVVGRAGWHMADTACPIGEGTFDAACGAAACAISAADIVLGGEPAAYALCRPPGHHAFADMAGGFCFLNNSAIAASQLRTRLNRVLILDVDVHHGNGTQAIFYRRDDVFTVSLHADPRVYYPFFWGHAHERGAGAGVGFNLNLPLALGTIDDSYLEVLDQTLPTLQAFAPQALVVALGLDAYEGDPLQGMRITTGGFHRIGALIASLHLPFEIACSFSLTEILHVQR